MVIAIYVQYVEHIFRQILTFPMVYCKPTPWDERISLLLKHSDSI